MTRNRPLAGPDLARACSLRNEGSRLAPHQEGWALEALKYAGSYVPPTSLALSSLRCSELQLRKTSPSDPFSQALPKKRALPVKRGPLRAREALRPSAPFQARFGYQSDSPSRFRSIRRPRLALEPALRTSPRGRSPRLPISSEDDTFTKLATRLTADQSPKAMACPLQSASSTRLSDADPWRGESHRTGDERARRQDRLTVSFDVPKDASRGVHVSRPGQERKPRRTRALQLPPTAPEGSAPLP
jgi:hypothetical protein